MQSKNKLSQLLAVGCLIGAAFGCGTPENSQFADRRLDLSNSVNPRLARCTSGQPKDSIVAIQNARVEKDELSFDVQYGGGCKQHSFGLCWDETFLESNPLQVDLVLRHDSNGDLCEALPTEKLRFDISEIKSRYKEAYRSATGFVQLRLDQVVQTQYAF